MIRRLLARWACHHNLWCCPKIDTPFCHTWADPHTLARWRYRRHINRLRNQRGRR